MNPITILSPRPFQVIQRQSREQGRVLVSGRVAGFCEQVQVRFSGESPFGELPQGWQSIPHCAGSGSFNAVFDLPAGGWYSLDVQALSEGRAVGAATVAQFGLGEVFATAGQSNSTNCGQFPIQQYSGMVSSFGGTHWQIADDPQPGCHDQTQGGSPWPAFGDALYAKLGVPVGIAATGHGGTSVDQWKPGEELFDWMMTRLWQLGPQGFRGVLWHQGESDVMMQIAEYVEKLTEVIHRSQQDAGWAFPWFVAKVSYHNVENPRWESTRAAHQQLWDTGVALEGPDTDVLEGDHRDFDGTGIHFSPKGLKAHGEMWAEIIAAYLGKVL